MNGQEAGVAIAEPPEGALAGENVPRDSEEDEIEENVLDSIEAKLKLRGEPFKTMSEDELREHALEFYNKYVS